MMLNIRQAIDMTDNNLTIEKKRGGKEKNY